MTEKEIDLYREHLEDQRNEELLGEDYLDELRQDEIAARLEAIEDDLNHMYDEELLGGDFLEESAGPRPPCPGRGRCNEEHYPRAKSEVRTNDK